MNTTTHRKLCILAILILCACLAFWWVKRPAGVELAREKTDATVAKLETVIKSQDKAVERIVTGARKEVAERNAEIRKDVSGLDPSSVATELMALLDEYRLERGD